MARSAGIPWGTYYECWGVHKDYMTVPYSSVPTVDNEWCEYELRDQIIKNTGGRNEKGGSSRSLQERILLYSYFSGASAIGEEYGVCNTFRNFDDFELSEYGQVKKNFLDFVEKYPDIGETYTPFAIVLPAEIEVLAMNDDDNSYLQYPLYGTSGKTEKLEYVDSDISRKVRNVRKNIYSLLYSKDKKGNLPGRDDHCMQNGEYPDVFDVIHGDQAEALSKYEYLIDLTSDVRFAKRHKNTVKIEDIPMLLEKLLPCTIDNDVHYIINRTKCGWLVLAINNNGVIWNDYDEEHFLPEAEITSKVHINDKSLCMKKLEGSGRLTSENGEFYITLGAGQWIMFSLS